MPNTITARFAPSPTGYLHVGGARTALFSWLLARHEGAAGRFLLRIEDTDLARSTQQACDQLLEDLKWLGLLWDNASSLVHQSQRVAIYNKIIDDLIARDLAYKDYTPTEDVTAMRKRAQLEKRDFIYRRPTLNPERQAQYERENAHHVVRFATPVKDYSFHDVVLQKEVTVASTQVQDFVIRKGDGMPTYHFAVVVDDAEMGVSHILRGQEHTLNTMNHIALQEALNYPRPTYGHLPIIMNPDSTKMGKRDRDKKIRAKAQEFLKHTKQSSTELAAAANLPYLRVNDWLTDSSTQLDLSDQKTIMNITGLKETDLPEIMVHDFRKNGYLPEALLNFLALLGWNPGGDREFMTMADLTSLFSIDGIGKSNAKFDRVKLLSFNTEHCAKATPARLLAAFRDYLSVNPESPLNHATDAQLASLLEMKKGFRTLREVDDISRFLFTPDADLPYDPAAIDKVLLKNDRQGLTALTDLRPILAGATPFTAATLEPLVQSYADSKQLPLGKVAQPLRVAISGTTVSPTIFAVLEFLGQSRSLARIDRCLTETKIS